MCHLTTCPSYLPDLTDAQLYEPIDPARCTCPMRRQLADVAAKRAILDLHEVLDNEVGEADSRYCRCCFRDYNGDYLLSPVWCRTVRHLALPYADQPGYDETWRPTR